MRIGFKKALALSAALIIGMNTVTLSAATTSETIKITYNNIRVSYNGQYKTPNLEPFNYKGSVYVGVRDVGQMVGANVNWNPTTQTVEITGQTGASQAEIAAKNLEIAKLRSEVAALQAKLNQYETQQPAPDTGNGTTLDKISTRQINDLITFLKREFRYEHDIAWAFEISVNTRTNKLDLVVSYDGRYDQKYFTALSQRDLEYFLQDVSDEVQKALGYFPITGELKDETQREALANFSMDEKGVFEYTHLNSRNSLRRFQEYMQDTYRKLPDIKSGTLNGKTIAIDRITLKEERDFRYITCEMDTDLSSTHAATWNDLRDSSDLRNLRYWLEDRADEIARQFGCDPLNVAIFIHNAQDRLIAKYEDGQLRLYTFSE